MSHPDSLALNTRVRQIRREVYGENGIPTLAEALGVSARTWENFEAGVAIPGTVILEFVALTGVAPDLALDGKGEPYSGDSSFRNASR